MMDNQRFDTVTTHLGLNPSPIEAVSIQQPLLLSPDKTMVLRLCARDEELCLGR
jgi:hypothetical protein